MNKRRLSLIMIVAIAAGIITVIFVQRSVSGLNLFTGVPETPEASFQEPFVDNRNATGSTTMIHYFIHKENTPVLLEIYSVKGKLIKTLVDRIMAQGDYMAEWDRKNIKEQKVPSGLYLYRLIVDDQIITKKLIVMNPRCS